MFFGVLAFDFLARCEDFPREGEVRTAIFAVKNLLRYSCIFMLMPRFHVASVLELTAFEVTSEVWFVTPLGSTEMSRRRHWSESLQHQCQYGNQSQVGDEPRAVAGFGGFTGQRCENPANHQQGE